MDTKNAKIAITGLTIISGEIVVAATHAGVVGTICAAGVGAAAYLLAGDLERSTGRELALPKPSHQLKTLGYRLFNGKSVRNGEHPEDEETLEVMDWSEGHQLPAYLEISPDLRMKPNELIAKSIFIAGQRRSGKTTLGALLAELFGAQYIPLFIPDREGDYLTVYDLLPHGVIAGAPGSYDPEKITFREVTPDSAKELGFDILFEGLQVILDLNTFEIDEGFAVVIGIIEGLIEFANQYPNLRCPVEVFLDEAQKYLPQDLTVSHIKNKEIREQLLELYGDLFTSGGKRGLTPVVLSQRFAETNNKVMAQAEVRFILRQTHDTDLNRCMKYVEKGVAEREDIRAFRQGEGVFIGDDGTQFITRFHKRQSDGGRSHTPKAEAAYRFIDQPPSAKASRTPEPEPTEAPTRPVSTRPAGSPKRETPSLSQAFDAYDPTTGHHGLARTLHISTVEAGQLIQAMKQRRMLNPDGTKVEQTPEKVIPFAQKNTDPEANLTDDDRRVLEAYQAGHKSGGAINAAISIPLNRANVSLHRLSNMGLIDWQAKKR